MDPLSIASAWVVNKVTQKAISFASDQAEESAKSVVESLFIKAQDQFKDLQVAIESKIDKAVEQTVQQITQFQYGLETTKIVSAFEIWTKSWSEALAKAKNGDMIRISELRAQFRHSEYGAQTRLNLLHKYLIGQGGLADSEKGYLKVLEEGIFERLEKEEDFTIQHYYDSLVIIISKIIRIQLIGLYFRLCAEEIYTQEDFISWSEEVCSNIAVQKAKVIEYMPHFIRHIKPDFDTPAIDCHWWRFLEYDDSRYCLAVRSEDAWYTKFDVKNGNSRGQLVQSEGTKPCPWHEFRWESNILTDRVPQPKTALERNPDGNPQQYSEVQIARRKDHKADLTTILCRHTHQRICAFQTVAAKGTAEAWNTVYWKILPVKGKSMPTFRLLGMYPAEVSQWKDGRGSINLGELYIKQSTVYYLEDNGTSQEDF